MIEITGLSKRFGNYTVFSNISARVKAGECIAVIGPSGSGKSVFFRTVAGLEQPDAGHIVINGADITSKGVNINKIREKMGMVYQGFHLFSHLNVMDNITLAPRKVKKQDKTTAEKKALELLSLVGLVEKAGQYPHQLSGGQQQRIAIARCMAMEPEIILFDEPTSALDPKMTYEVLAIIRKLAKMGLTTMIATHEMEFAREVADRVFYFDEGTLYEEGSPEEIFGNPQREKTRAFIRKLKVFNYQIHSKDFDYVSMNADIEVFCNKHGLSSEQSYFIRLILEELIVVLFKKLYTPSPPDIKIMVWCEEKLDEVSIQMDYRGDSLNPLEYSGDEEEDLGILMVNRIAKKAEHGYKEASNKLFITF